MTIPLCSLLLKLRFLVYGLFVVIIRLDCVNCVKFKSCFPACDYGINACMGFIICRNAEYLCKIILISVTILWSVRVVV